MHEVDKKMNLEFKYFGKYLVKVPGTRVLMLRLIAGPHLTARW